MLGGAGSWELGGVGGAGRGWELELGDGMCWEVLRGAGSWELGVGRSCRAGTVGTSGDYCRGLWGAGHEPALHTTL